MAEKPAAPESNTKPRHWLHRALGQWRAWSRGDTITGQIGERSKNVVIGKNVIQIGSITMPIWLALVIALCLGALVVVGIINLIHSRKVAESSEKAVSILSFTATPTLTPTFTATPTPVPTATSVMMPKGNYNYNIAVSAFVAKNVAGDEFYPEEAKNRAINITDYLADKEEFTKLLLDVTGLQVNIWGPAEYIPLIKRVTIEEQARALGADIVIYGELHQLGEEDWRLYPAFYISQSQQDHYGTISDLVGSHTLGSAISYDESSISEIRDLTTQLQKRLHALAQMILGLDYHKRDTLAGYCTSAWFFWSIVENSDLRPDQFAPCPIPDGLSKFQDEESSNRSITTQVGDEVVYLFLGNAYVQIARLLNRNGADYITALETARQAYQQGLTANPTYSRLLNGLGNANYFEIRTMYQNSCEAVSREQVAETHQLYNQASQNLTQPALPQGVLQGDEYYVKLVASLGIGRLHDLTYRCNLDKTQEFDLASESFTQITEYYRQHPRDLYLPVAVYAHIDLALLLFQQAIDPQWPGDLDEAADMIEQHLQTAIHLSQYPDFDWLRMYVEDETSICQLTKC